MFSAAKTAGPSGYNISRSVRLRSSASAYFNRTPSGSGSTTTATFSVWVKRGALGSTQAIFACERSSAADGMTIWFDSSDKLNVVINASGGTTNGALVTTQVFRDPSAWYHIVAAIDTTQGTAANRMLLYVNGVQVTAFTTNTNPTQNSTIWVGTASLINYIGRVSSSATWFFDGYLAEYNVINGQALTPSSFGSTNAITGVWQPKKYTGTYGTNGFYLNFSDNSAATAAAIGKDYSGNGNNWTPNNISVTAGATYDSMVDVPTPYADGSTNRGNYSVFNPLNQAVSNNLSAANLRFTCQTANWQSTTGTVGVSSGKWYWEVTVGSNGVNGTMIGVCEAGRVFIGGGTYPGQGTTGYTYYSANGQKYNNGSNAAYGATYTNGDVIGVALDMDGGTLTFYKNNASQGQAFSGITGTMVAAIGIYDTGYYSDINFGQRPFSYTPPSGYKALNTYNLPASTILNGGKYMAATTYTGTGAIQNITNAGSFKPDLVWIKSRSTVGDTEAYDSVRGATKYLLTDSTVAEGTIAQSLTAFNSNGFALGTGSGANDNTNGTTYIGWQWQAGQGSTSSNASGTITSTVSVSATAGFSVVSYTANGAAAQTIGHGLGVAPSMVVTKCRSAGSSNWGVYHRSIGNTGALFLNTTNATATSSLYWNNTSPTSSVFSVGTNNTDTNYSTNTMVAYCWSEIAGFSKFGSYTGNGSTDGPFVYTGLRPRFLMIKRTDAAGNNWVILDTSRDTYNAAGLYLYPNLSAAEDDYRASTGPVDILSNGFKQRSTLSNVNASGATYIYAAFAENPFANALAR